MKQDSRILAFVLVLLMAYALPHSGIAETATYTEKDYYFREPGPVITSQLYLDGSTVELETGYIIYPVVGSDLSQITPEEFRDLALMNKAAMEKATDKVVVSPDRAGRGLNIVYNCTNVPQAALPALESVAVYIESLFSDEVTVSINMSFASLPAGVLGQSISYYAGAPSWDITRSSLVADMDSDDSIQTWLPSGSTIPVRYTYTNATVTNEDRVYVLVAPYNAAIGPFSSTAASITYSTNFTWDYEPWNGVTGYCFQSVVAHEIGHVLGFVSNADGYGNDIDLLDIYRFQLSDGTGNFNPDTWYDFQNTARMVDISSGTDDVNSDMIAVEYRMSDGDPWQASHFSQGYVAAIMQPAMSSGQTYYPHFYRTPDRAMFDAVGWDYLMSYYLTLNIYGSGTVTADPSLPSYPAGTLVEITAIPDAGWDFISWSGSHSGTANPDTIIMDSDKIITATFATTNCTLTVNIIGNGTVIQDPNLPYYPRGSSVILTAVPDSGWTFLYWSGNLGGTQNPDTIIMNGDKTVNAYFGSTGVEEGHLTSTTGNHFSITPNPSSGTVSMRYQTTNPAARVDLLIYDASGQLVRSFYGEASIPNQEYEFLWQGDDNAGRKLPGGVYFAKLRAGEYIETVKVLMIK